LLVFKVAAPRILGAIQQQFEGDLRRLKTLLEERAPAAN
jgi:hypothetical protein